MDSVFRNYFAVISVLLIINVGLAFSKFIFNNLSSGDGLAIVGNGGYNGQIYFPNSIAVLKEKNFGKCRSALEMCR